MHTSRLVASSVALLAVASLAAGCGGDGDSDRTSSGDSREDRALEAAENPTAADFPPVKGQQTLQEVARGVMSGPKVGLATADLTPGENRLAFGLIRADNSFIYGKTAVYLAPTPADKAEGPYLAPAQSLLVEPPFRSQGSATEKNGLAAIYSARVPFPRPGTYALLVVVNQGQTPLGAGITIKVAARSGVVAVGDKAPAVDTDTLTSAGGDIAAIDTRRPNDDMHETNLKDVLGKKPVALLFATPQLCQSRVCGPVTDIAAQVKKDYGDRVEFIHQEVYVDNSVKKGLRAPLKSFGLRTEPWLFTIDRDGRVAARLEGSFGIDEFEAAVKAAL